MSNEKALKKASEQKLKDIEKNVEAEITDTDEIVKLELTDDITGLIEYFNGIQEFSKQPVNQPLHVDALASKFASVYEKARRVIDWKEEHLIRRTAIERSLKRRLLSKLSGITFLSEVSPEHIAEPFVLELIRSGHFANNSIPQAKIEVIRKALAKYIHVLGYGLASDEVNPIDIKTKVQFYNWLLEVAACEFEEILDPPLEESGMINFMTKIMSDRIKILPASKMKVEEVKIQTFIAVQKALFNLDSPIVTYNLIKYKYPEWIDNSEENQKRFTKEILKIWRDIDEILDYSENSKFFNLSERYDAPYLILSEVLKNVMKKPSEMKDIFSDWSRLGKEVKKVYEGRLSTLKSRLQRSAIYSTLSMLLAGIVSLFLVEGPIAKLVHGDFRLWAMAVDLAIPAGMMFVLVSLIRLPGKDNYEVLTREIKKIVYKQPEIITYEINLAKQRNFLRNIFFGFFYLIGTIVSFGVVFYIFKIAHVPWTSLYIDTANIAVVVFAALIVKQRSMEVTMEENAKLADFFIDMFSIPLANLGQWLSNKWKEFNFVSVFFTTVIDLPLVTLFELIEDWRSFLKDKKAGIH